MAFHPSVTDVHGCFHLMKHFISILDSKLGSSENDRLETTTCSQQLPQPHEEQQTHLPIESLLPSISDSFNLRGKINIFSPTLNFRILNSLFSSGHFKKL